jgi:hypothetical protein
MSELRYVCISYLWIFVPGDRRVLMRICTTAVRYGVLSQLTKGTKTLDFIPGGDQTRFGQAYCSYYNKYQAYFEPTHGT